MNKKDTIKYIIDCIDKGILPEIPEVRKNGPNFGLQPYIEIEENKNIEK